MRWSNSTHLFVRKFVGILSIWKWYRFLLLRFFHFRQSCGWISMMQNVLVLTHTYVPEASCLLLYNQANNINHFCIRARPYEKAAHSTQWKHLFLYMKIKIQKTASRTHTNVNSMSICTAVSEIVSICWADSLSKYRTHTRRNETRSTALKSVRIDFIWCLNRNFSFLIFRRFADRVDLKQLNCFRFQISIFGPVKFNCWLHERC